MNILRDNFRSNDHLLPLIYSILCQPYSVLKIPIIRSLCLPQQVFKSIHELISSFPQSYLLYNGSSAMMQNGAPVHCFQQLLLN